MQFRAMSTLFLLLKIAAFSEVHLSAAAHHNGGERLPVDVGVFLPTKDDFTMLSTVQAAVDHVNNLEGILDDYELRIRWNWTEVRYM